VALWREDYRHLEENPAWMIERLRHLRPLVGATEFSLWQELAEACKVPDLFERLMRVHYDPAYQRSTTKHYANLQGAIPIDAPDLERSTLRQIADGLIAKR
jgi:tRNA 2-selenouridine synthase